MACNSLSNMSGLLLNCSIAHLINLDMAASAILSIISTYEVCLCVCVSGGLGGGEMTRRATQGTKQASFPQNSVKTLIALRLDAHRSAWNSTERLYVISITFPRKAKIERTCVGTDW